MRIKISDDCTDSVTETKGFEVLTQRHFPGFGFDDKITVRFSGNFRDIDTKMEFELQLTTAEADNLAARLLRATGTDAAFYQYLEGK